jgi:hypothetical protein
MSRSPAVSRTAHAHVAFFVIKPEVGWRVYWTMVSAGTLASVQRKECGESESPARQIHLEQETGVARAPIAASTGSLAVH